MDMVIIALSILASVLISVLLSVVISANVCTEAIKRCYGPVFDTITEIYKNLDLLFDKVGKTNRGETKTKASHVADSFD